MGLTDTPGAERLHIAFFGIRNAGKSSLINAVTAQTVSVVSDTPGTTTDPVTKTMELQPLGPVVLIDTPGIDDEGPLGEQRIARTKEVLRRTDIAVLVTDARNAGRTPGETTFTPAENDLRTLFEKRRIPCLIAYNKADLVPERPSPATDHEVFISAMTGEGVEAFKNRLAAIRPADKEQPIVSDLVRSGDTVILVTPIDESAPKGRLILPQQLVLRELLDHEVSVFVTKETTYAGTLARLKDAPALVITDSQVFEQIDRETPREVPLTSFSILMARHKGTLTQALKGAKALDTLQDGDTVLISEGCTHHRQCKDIGTVKLPHWIDTYTDKKLHYSFTSGGTFPEDLSSLNLIVHCGGCMLNEQEMTSRAEISVKAGIPMTNYGTAIAQMHGILDRSTEIFRK